MSDLSVAMDHLPGHTLALCRNGAVITSDKRGVAPMVDFFSEGKDLAGYSAADKTVGKAAAMLFIKAGISELYADVLSHAALSLLESHGVKVSFTTLTDRILNRDGTGLCPMESAVIGTDDIDKGVKIITEKLELMRNNRSN